MKFFLVFFLTIFLSFTVESSDKVGKVEDLGNLQFPNSKIAYINPVEAAIYEINQEGVITGNLRYHKTSLAPGIFKTPI